MRTLATCIAVLSAGCALSTTVVPDDGPLNEAAVIAEIHAGEQARRAAAAAGDEETAMRHMAPEFLFVHSTGQVDDLAAFRAFAQRVSGGGSREEPRLLEDPKYVVQKDFAVRTQLTSSSPRANLPAARFRSVDVFVRRAGKWLWLAHQGTMVQPPWRTVPASAALLQEYAGTYAAENGQARTYTTSGDTLVQSGRDGAPEVTLTPLSDSTFAVPPGAATVTFLRDRNGKVTRAQVIGPLGLSVLHRK